jgi:hypothetical protein
MIMAAGMGATFGNRPDVPLEPPKAGGMKAG